MNGRERPPRALDLEEIILCNRQLYRQSTTARREHHIEDTVGALSALVAEGIEQSAKQIERLSNFTPVASERHNEGNMAVTDACRRDGAICYC